jgi:hypothetical protein
MTTVDSRHRTFWTSLGVWFSPPTFSQFSVLRLFVAIILTKRRKFVDKLTVIQLVFFRSWTLLFVLDHILSLAHILTCCAVKVHFDVISTFRSTYLKWRLSFSASAANLCAFLMCPMHVPIFLWFSSVYRVSFLQCAVRAWIAQWVQRRVRSWKPGIRFLAEAGPVLRTTQSLSKRHRGPFPIW